MAGNLRPDGAGMLGVDLGAARHQQPAASPIPKGTSPVTRTSLPQGDPDAAPLAAEDAAGPRAALPVLESPQAQHGPVQRGLLCLHGGQRAPHQLPGRKCGAGGGTEGCPTNTRGTLCCTKHPDHPNSSCKAHACYQSKPGDCTSVPGLVPACSWPGLCSCSRDAEHRQGRTFIAANPLPACSMSKAGGTRFPPRLTHVAHIREGLTTGSPWEGARGVPQTLPTPQQSEVSAPRAPAAVCIPMVRVPLGLGPAARPRRKRLTPTPAVLPLFSACLVVPKIFASLISPGVMQLWQINAAPVPAIPRMNPIRAVHPGTAPLRQDLLQHRQPPSVSALPLLDGVLRADFHRDPSPELHGGFRHGLLQPLGAIHLLHQQSLQ